MMYRSPVSVGFLLRRGRALVTWIVRSQLPMAGKGILGVLFEIAHPTPQNRLVQIQITRRLRDADTTLGHKVDRFSLELPAELSSRHRYSPGSRTPYPGVHKSGSSSTDRNHPKRR